MRKYIGITAIMALIVLSASASAAPQGLTATITAEPGDAAMINGDDFSDVSSVKLYRLPDEDVTGVSPQYVRISDPGEFVPNDSNPHRVSDPWDNAAAADTEILGVNADGVQFAVPQNMSYGVYEVRAYDSDGESESFMINRAKIKWVQGDEGIESSPGGWLRVNGRNLAGHEGNVQLAMENTETGTFVFLNPSEIYDAYSLEYKVPQDIPTGKYNLYAHNGFGGKSAWSHPIEYNIVQKTTWKPEVFNVKDFGAVGDGKTNDTFAVYAALSAAEKNNGGTVYFPQGRYYMTATINMPRYTVLKGEANHLSQIFWNDEQWDIDELPESIIFGKDNFGVEDLDIRGGRCKMAISSDCNSSTAGNVFVKNCYISFSSLGKRIESYKSANKNYLEVLVEEILNSGQQFLITIGGENIEISGNYVYGACGSVSVINAQGAIIKDNTFDIAFKGWNGAMAPQKLIIENNIFMGQGMGINTLLKTNGASDVYYARNKVYQVNLNDREVITTDGGESLFSGIPLGIEGTTVLLPENKSNLADDAYKNYACIIVSGKGKGQHRKIVSNTQNSVELSSPFKTEPDRSSVIVILKDMSYMYYIDNKLGEASNFQMYGLSFESVLEGNKLNRTNGIRAISGLIYKAVQPNFYLYIANNTLEGGYYYHWYGIEGMDGWSGQVHIALDSSSKETAYYHYGSVIRDNVLKECGRIKLHGTSTENTLSNIIVDNNCISKNTEGISVQGAVQGILFYRNTFNEVDNPYVIDETASEEGRIVFK